MKWRQRFILTALALGICLVLTIFLVESDGIGLSRNSYRRDQISVGESEKLKKNMDIYPGKQRKRGYDFMSLRRELQRKSRSADQDQDDSQKNIEGLFGDHDWLAYVDSEQQKLFADLISKISSDEEILNKVLKAAYLIVSENAGSDINNLHSSVKETDLEQIKGFLNSNGLLKSVDKSDKQQNVPKRPAKVIVSPEELDLLKNLKPRDVRYAGRDQHEMRKNPRKLRLKKSNLLSEWDGKELADHWKRFYTSISSTEMFPNPSESSVADDIAHNLASQEIIGVENMDGGTQIKLLFYLKDGGKAVFKPMRVTRETETDSNIFYWRDYERATAEVAAYHLDRVLDMRRTSPCVSRIVNITSELWRLADRDLAKTFFVSPGNNVCFYGDCKYYCDTGHPVCGRPDILDGSLCAWLPDVPRYRVKSPWRRSYSKTKLAEWEEDDTYCEKIKIKAPYNKGRRLLDVMDLETFDFLMYNMDRHHLETFDEFGNNSFVINLDNGRGFGTHSSDELSIFAPIYQCCLFRHSMLQKLLQFHQGPIHLGEALKRSLRTEAIHPVLVDEHYEAIDRRVNITLNAVAECVQNHGASKVVFNDGF